MRIKYYGRLGTRADLDAKIADARNNGAHVSEQTDAGVVVAMLQGQPIFRALEKSPDTWLILYNPQFYPTTPFPVMP